MGVVLIVFLYGAGAFLAALVPYWIIRLAVRHAIEDVLEREERFRNGSDQ